MEKQQLDHSGPSTGSRTQSRSRSRSGPLATSSIDLAVDIERAWQALVTDGGLEPWMGGGASIDAVVDGELRLPDPVGGRPRRGRVERLEHRQRLDFTWWPEDRPIERSLVSIVLEPIDSGTRLTVTETVPRSISRSARASSVAPAIGAWSWRLAQLVLACNPALV